MKEIRVKIVAEDASLMAALGDLLETFDRIRWRLPNEPRQLLQKDIDQLQFELERIGRK